jgi:glycosyltransferase involved in cell wall biosynthesis
MPAVEISLKETIVATYSSYLAESLVKQGHEVKVLGENKDVLPTGFDPDFPGKAIPFVECWNRNEPFTKLLDILKTDKPDVLHIQHQFALFPFTNTLKELLEGAKSLGVRVIFTLHDVVPRNSQMDLYFSTIISNSDNIIVHNDNCKSIMLNSWNCPPEKLKRIYHGTKLIDMPPKEESRKRLKIPLDTKVMLSWGFAWESKGLTDLIEILAELKKKYSKIMFIHVGGLHPVFARGEYLTNLLKKAYKLGIRPSELMITGFVKEDEIPTYFSVADVIVLNYMRGSASASGAAHRVLAAHKPIVRTDDPCLEEISGCIVPRFDKSSLYQNIVKVLESVELQNKLIVESASIAEATCWDKISVKHLEVYNG